ncbi:MAG: hypothetical protein COA36_06160 [Desulfotalea sp.]|nr:MAG: hypothetical protein COA36_06160 [Desulfotalea sp.]
MQKEYDLSLPVAEAKNPLVLGKLLSIETLFRLNPHWMLESVEEENGNFEAHLKDHVTEQEFSLSGTIAAPEKGRLVVTLDHEIYQSIEIFTTKENLMGVVTYGCTEEELTEEVERHVVLWLRSVKEYLRMYLKESLNAKIFRYVMNKIVLTMTPSQRKISLMLIRITVVEIIVILFIVVGYVIFVLK